MGMCEFDAIVYAQYVVIVFSILCRTTVPTIGVLYLTITPAYNS